MTIARCTSTGRKANPFAGLSTSATLRALAERFGDQPAIVYGDSVVTFADVEHSVETVAVQLADLGVEAGDRVGIWMGNGAEFMFAFGAVARLGAVAVLINTRLTLDEVRYQVVQSGASCLIVSGEAHRGRARLGEAQSLLAGALKLVATFAEDGIDDGSTHRLRAVASGGSQTVPPRDEPDSPLAIVYTSGTTAEPKGVVLTHCMWRKAFDGGTRFGVRSNDRLLLCVPMFGVLGLLNGVMSWWVHGAAVVVLDHFEPAEVLTVAATRDCTAMHVIPAMVRPLLEAMDAGATVPPSLRTGVVLTSDPDVVRLVAERLGMPEAIASYGSTETTGVVARPWHHEPLEVRATSQGPPMPGVEIRVVAEDGTLLGSGRTGELQVRGYCVTPGYFRKPEESAASLTSDGWFRTGDLGQIDEQGHVHFQMRSGDSYKHRGFNVSCREVEQALTAHPSVQEAVVVPVSDPHAGNIAVGFVVPSADRTPTPDEILAHARARLAHFKVPASVVVVDNLPRAASTGKVLIRELRAQARAHLDARGAPDALDPIDTTT